MNPAWLFAIWAVLMAAVVIAGALLWAARSAQYRELRRWNKPQMWLEDNKENR